MGVTVLTPATPGLAVLDREVRLSYRRTTDTFSARSISQAYNPTPIQTQADSG